MLAAEEVAGSQDPLRAAVAHRLATGQLSLPMLPRVASQVVALVGSPTTDANRLSELIHRDPALAGQVLRIANSPAYMPRMPIVSLQQAVSRLGLNVVSEIAFAASLQSGVFRVPGYESVLNQLWRHALASGAFAKEIARVRRLNVESAFLCGLLHSVGKPALLQLVNDVAKTTRRCASGRSRSSRCSTTCTPWSVCASPSSGACPSRWSRRSSTHAATLRPAAFRQEAMITFLADRLATHAIEPARFGGDDGFRDTPVIAELNLYPDDVAGLLARRERVLELVAAMVA